MKKVKTVGAVKERERERERERELKFNKIVKGGNTFIRDG